MTGIEQRPQQLHQGVTFSLREAERPIHSLDFSRTKKPSGLKKEKRKGKLPNEIRHDLNAAVAIGTWKKKGRMKIKIK